MKPRAGGRQPHNDTALSGAAQVTVPAFVTGSVHDPAQIARALMDLAVEAAEPAPLLDANNLERLFHFDNTVKKWTFYDPRPEFGSANTITELFPGKVYWIKVKGDQVAVLNGRERNLTCVNKGAPNENCWNQVAW